MFIAACTCCTGTTAFYSYVWCDRSFEPEVASPDGEYVAQVYHEDCEAMGSPGTTEVTLHAKSKRGLIPGFPKGDTVFSIRADIIPIELEWMSTTYLVIRYPMQHNSTDILRQRTSWDGIEIEYVATDPGG